jgi:hypothetical protein
LQKVGGLVRLEAFLFEEGFDALPLGQAHHGKAGGDFARVEAIATKGLASVVAWRGLEWGLGQVEVHVLIRKRLYFGGMKKLLFFSACLVALSSAPVKAQTGGPAVAVVSIWYTGASAGAGHLLVDRDGTATVTDFEAGGGMKAAMEQAQRVRAEVLRKAVA